MLSYIILGSKSPETDVVKWSAIIIAFIGLIKFAIDKGAFNFIKDMKSLSNEYTTYKKDNRELSKEQINILKNHSLFNDYNIIISYGLLELYNSSKKGVTQLLFILQLHYTLIVHQQDMEALINELIAVKKKNNTTEQTIKKIISSILSSKDSVFDVLHLKGIPPEITTKFSIWYNEHYSWYLSSVHTLLEEETSYFSETQQFLTISKIFTKAIITSAKNHIDSFNGDISTLLTKDILNDIDFDKYLQYYNLIKTLWKH